MLRRWLMVSSGIVASLALFWHLAKNANDLFHQRRQLHRAQAEVDRLNGRIAELERERERLKSDDRYLEAVARDDLGMVKPGEIVYYFPQSN